MPLTINEVAMLSAIAARRFGPFRPDEISGPFRHLIANGLAARDGRGIPVLTERGRALLSFMCDLPLPVAVMAKAWKLPAGEKPLSAADAKARATFENAKVVEAGAVVEVGREWEAAFERQREAEDKAGPAPEIAGEKSPAEPDYRQILIAYMRSIEKLLRAGAVAPVEAGPVVVDRPEREMSPARAPFENAKVVEASAKASWPWLYG
jgi:hypothetical protein